MSRPLVVLGAGGHAREVLDIVEALASAARGDGLDPPWELLGLAADGHADLDQIDRRGATFLGPIEEAVQLDAHYVIGIGASGVRRDLDRRLSEAGRSAATLVHPTAVIGADVVFEPGVVIAAGSHVTTNVRLGRHVHLNVGAVVSHDARVGDHTTISPGCLLNGNVTIGSEVFVGTGAVITPGRTIGEGAVLGAGAVVVHDIPAGVTAVGVPARW